MTRSDTEAWNAFAEAVRSAHRGDGQDHVAALRKLAPRLDLARRAGMFVWFALRHQVAGIVHGAPQDRDIQDIAASAMSKMEILPRVDEVRVRDTLLTVFDMAEPGRRVVGGDFVVIGTALLGALVVDPDEELPQIYRDMVDWYVQNKTLAGLD